MSSSIPPARLCTTVDSEGRRGEHTTDDALDKHTLNTELAARTGSAQNPDKYDSNRTDDQ